MTREAENSESPMSAFPDDADQSTPLPSIISLTVSKGPFVSLLSATLFIACAALSGDRHAK